MDIVELQDIQSTFSVLDLSLDCHNVKVSMKPDQEDMDMTLELVVVKVRANH